MIAAGRQNTTTENPTSEPQETIPAKERVIAYVSIGTLSLSLFSPALSNHADKINMSGEAVMNVGYGAAMAGLVGSAVLYGIQDRK